MEKPISNMLDVTLRRIKEMVDVNMIIGEQIVTPDGTTIIPVSKLSLGFGTGGTEFSNKHSNNPNANFGGGVGSGVHITPVLFLVVQNGNVRMITVEQSGENPFERIAELAPVVVDKVGAFFDKRKEKKAAKKAAEAEEIATEPTHTEPSDGALPEVPAE